MIRRSLASGAMAVCAAGLLAGCQAEQDGFPSHPQLDVIDCADDPAFFEREHCLVYQADHQRVDEIHDEIVELLTESVFGDVAVETRCTGMGESIPLASCTTRFYSLFGETRPDEHIVLLTITPDIPSGDEGPDFLEALRNGQPVSGDFAVRVFWDHEDPYIGPEVVRD